MSDYGKCSKFLFLFSDKLLVSRAGIHKMLVRIANGEDPDQTQKQSDLGLRCLSRLFGTQLLIEISKHLQYHLCLLHMG